MDGIMEAVREGGVKGPEAEDQKDTEQGAKNVSQDEATLFDDTSDDKDLKWRFVAKGAALEDLLAVIGARAVCGQKQVSFKVKDLGDRELGEVIRALFAKANAAGVTLRDLLALIRAKGAGVNVKETIDKLVEQTQRHAKR